MTIDNERKFLIVTAIIFMISSIIPVFIGSWVNHLKDNFFTFFMLIPLPILSTFISVFLVGRKIQYGDGLFLKGFVRSLFVSVAILNISLFIWSCLMLVFFVIGGNSSEAFMPFYILLLANSLFAFKFYLPAILAGLISWFVSMKYNRKSKSEPKKIASHKNYLNNNKVIMYGQVNVGLDKET